MICRRFSSPCVERTLFTVLVGSERHKGICESQYQVNNGRLNRLRPSNCVQDNAPKQGFCTFVEMILCNFHTTSQLPFTDYQRKTEIGNIILKIFRIINIFLCFSPLRETQNWQAGQQRLFVVGRHYIPNVVSTRGLLLKLRFP